MVFKHDRITLCGQTIFCYSRSKQTTRILEALNVKTQTGTWIAKSGPELVDELGSASGQNSITCSIRAFRESASADLGIARRWRKAAIHLHRKSLGLQPQDRQTRARNAPLGRPHRVYRSEQNWDLPAGGKGNLSKLMTAAWKRTFRLKDQNPRAGFQNKASKYRSQRVTTRYLGRERKCCCDLASTILAAL